MFVKVLSTLMCLAVAQGSSLRPPAPTTDCQKWCPRSGQQGQYDCCDQLPVRECPESCVEIYKPVCGSDGRDYDNECFLSIASCQNPDIVVQSQGKCGGVRECPESCVEYYNPVCGSDGRDYDNECFLSIASCHNPDIVVQSQGKCGGVRECPEFCAEIYEPVCGSDGRDYDNECFLFVASCLNPDIVVQSQGKCGGGRCITICTANYEPVCGSDGQTYSNACSLAAASCRYPSDNISVVYDGECEPVNECPAICLAIYDPVCGNDGITYGNSYALAAATCENPNANIATVYNGECDPDVTV